MQRFIFFCLTVLLLVGTSCESYLDGVNENPNNLAHRQPQNLLPAIEGRLGYAIGGEASRFASTIVSQVIPINRPSVQSFLFAPRGTDDLWGEVFYAGILMDIQELKAISDANGWNHYGGIARALEAYSLMYMTDVWGDIPYSEAFRGAEDPSPIFDPQESIYETIFSLLAEAESAFNASGGAKTPSSDDIIYQGDISKWKKFSKAIEARGHLHIVGQRPEGYSRALDALSAALTAAEDDAFYPYSGETDNEAPWYQFNTQRLGDFLISPDFETLLEDLNDPRANIFAVNTDFFPHPFFQPNQKVSFFSYTEQKFMEAECHFQLNATDEATQNYLEAIEASFARTGQSDQYADYVAQAEVAPGPNGPTLNQIMTQKYIALYTNPEVFNDWRRTGLPVFEPVFFAESPRRLPYPQKSIDLNPNTPSPNSVGIFNRIWWDL